MRVLGAQAMNKKKREQKATSGPQGISTNAQTLDELLRLQAHVNEQCRLGHMDSKTADSMTKGIRSAQALIEKRDLLRQVQALRKEIAEARGRKPAQGNLRAV
jgi:hypothetical protein